MPAIVTRRNRQTGTLVTVIHGDDAGLDTVGGEQPWYNICEPHGSLCQHSTRALATRFAASPLDWCEDCRSQAGAS